MTVKELIEILERVDPNLEVIVHSSFHPICGVYVYWDGKDKKSYCVMDNDGFEKTQYIKKGVTHAEGEEKE